MHNYTRAITELYHKHADNTIAEPMAKYMKNNFSFLGIKTPERKVLNKEFFKEYGLPDNSNFKTIIEELWAQPEREFHYLALVILEKFVKKAPKEQIDFYEHLAVRNSWWDSIDYIAPHHMGIHFKIYPELIESYVIRWAESENIWLKRCAILFQLKYKADTDLKLLYRIIDITKDTGEFFVNKAIGWILREYSKTDAEEIIRYVDKHPELSPLTKREAMKVIERKSKAK
jgi:3-methyladenine DNA glycosylase AlkD